MSLVGGLFVFSGCLGGTQQPSESQTTNHNPDETFSEGLTARIQRTNYFMRSSIEEGIAGDFRSSKVIIRGVYRPSTACHNIFVKGIERLGEDEVRITISQRKDGESEGTCEGAYVFYQIRVSGSTLPSSIQVRHTQSGEEFNITRENPGTLPSVPSSIRTTTTTTTT